MSVMKDSHTIKYGAKLGESKMEVESKKFNKRALTGSIIIHLMIIFLIKVPELKMEHKLKEDPKLIPIEMVELSTPRKLRRIQKPIEKPLIADKSLPVNKPKTPEPVVKKSGTEQVIKDSTALGDSKQKVVQDVQKGDPKSKIREAYKPGTDFRKLPKTDIGTGAAKGKVPSQNNNPGGSGDTYNAGEFSNLTDGLIKKGGSLGRLKKNKNAADDGGAGGGTGGGLGDGIGGGSGDGHFTGTTTGTTNTQKIATNIGSLTGSTTGKIDSSKGFSGLASKGEITVAGVPIERIQVPTIDSEAVRRLLREHIPQFRHCYQTELDKKKQGTNLQGRVEFRFTIGMGGRVTSSEVSFAEITDDSVRGCIKNVLNGIPFPEPKGGKSVQVKQPMNFSLDRI